MKVAVVILNWNGIKFLQKFLPSVLNHNPHYSQIIVADNNSSDDSVDYLKRNYPQIQIVKNNVNGGFAKGYNDALKQIQATYYVLLNSDVEVTGNWIEPIITLMDSDKNIAACQPKIKSYYNKDFFEYAGAAGGFIDKYGYPFCRGRLFDLVEKDYGQYDNVREIFWATGACMFIRSELFHQLNGFDEDFFAHMEEIDLCWRLKNRGYKILFSPNSTVYHVGGGTLDKANPQKTYLNFRNNLWLLCKNHRDSKLYITLFMRMVFDGVAGIKFLVSGQFLHFVSVIKAHISFYASLKKIIRKRKCLESEIKCYSTSDMYQGSLVIDYFVKNKKTFSEIDF
jgi:GT2 family glycosyltransferase